MTHAHKDLSVENRTLTYRYWLTLLVLIFAGEMIFSLPFHIPRFFRPQMLTVFQLSNTELGDAFAFYGVSAMICYFPGGIIADYFSVRKLLTFSLLATAMGGLLFAQIPNGIMLYGLYGYWGITSILLFWAGMIKATRMLAGKTRQGESFGVLDGGRGLAAALMSSLALLVYTSNALPELPAANQQSAEYSIRYVIYFYTLATTLAAVLIWLVLPDISQSNGVCKDQAPSPMARVKHTLCSKVIWLQAAIVVCAYCGFKGADNYGLFAVERLGINKLESSRFISYAAYLRPIAAISAGLLADRLTAGSVTRNCFLLMTVSYLFLVLFDEYSLWIGAGIGNLVLSFLAVFALRGVYFALLEESQVSRYETGTAVGIISFIGYTPDIFFAAVTGRILDSGQAGEGFKNYFLLLTVIAMIGLIAAIRLNRFNQKIESRVTKSN